MTRLLAINTFEQGGIKMIDIESMIKALRLAWLKRIFNNNDRYMEILFNTSPETTWRSSNL